ncbi:uncharacterized protein [Palaemon carinicauda]|uniref:uncharacterized protein isoform X3 n=1 Tax=Palaemon carinicauda TaxID=392227 RepID=UPI0035B5F86E
MASDLDKKTYFSYLPTGPGGKIRLLVHDSAPGSEDRNSTPKTFIGKVTKVPVSSAESVGVIRSMAPPLKGIGETTQLVMGTKSTVGVLSGLPLPGLSGGKDSIPFVMVSKASGDVKTGTPLPVNGNGAIPFVMVSKASTNVLSRPLPVIGKMEKVEDPTYGFLPRPKRGRPRGSKARVVTPYPLVSKTPNDGKSEIPWEMRGNGENVLYAVPSKAPVDVKPGNPLPLKTDEVYPFVMTSQPPDGISGVVPSMKDVLWKGKSSTVSISKVSTVGSSQSVFVPVHVISSPSQNPVQQMQLTNSLVRHPYPQMQLVDTQVQKSPPQVQVLKSRVGNPPSQTQLQGVHVQNSSAQIKFLSTQVQKPHTQLLTTQAPMPVPRIAPASQRYIVGHSPHQILGQHVLTTAQSPLVMAPSAASSGNDVTTVVRTLVSPHVVAATSQYPGVGSKPSLPKVITGRIKPIQIITKGVVDTPLEDIPIVDLKEEESLDKYDKCTKPFQCSECGLLCADEKALEQHENNHLGEVNYICDQCGKEFSTKSSFEEHLKLHATEKKFECDVCHKKFDYRDNLIFHMRIHGGIKSFSAKCPICQKKFGNKSMRDSHLKNHTVEELRQYKQANSEIVPPPKNDVSYQCDVCSKAFPDKVSLENHKVVHIKYKRGPKLELKRKAILEGVKHSCEHCKKSFNSTQSLKSHLDVCEEKNKSNSVACAFCKKHYGVINQSKDDGSQGMKFICEPCCTFLAQKSQVSGFTPRLENRFICNKCDRCFESEAQLRDHLKSHKPVRCFLCNKNFPSFSALQEHKVSQHGQGRVKHLRGRRSLATKSNSPISGDRAGAKLKRRKKRKRIERSKSRNRIERMQYEQKLEEKRMVMMEAAENFEVPYKKARFQVDGGNISSAEEVMYSGDERKVGSFGEDEDSDDYDSDPNLGVPAEEDDDDDDDDFLESNQHTNVVDDDDNFDDEDFDDDDEDEDLGLFNKKCMKNLEVTIKQEPDDNEDNKAKVMGNFTVFNALPSKVKVNATPSLIPENEIKQEKPDDYEELDVQIKQEKEFMEEATVKEENVMIKEENTFMEEEILEESLLFPIKEEKLDESDLLVEDEYEFTPFGNPVKEERP